METIIYSEGGNGGWVIEKHNAIEEVKSYKGKEIGGYFAAVLMSSSKAYILCAIVQSGCKH